MRRLKQKQKHGCDYCRKDGFKVPAVWRNHGFSICACEHHKETLEQAELTQHRLDSHQTEAEFQLGV